MNAPTIVPVPEKMQKFYGKGRMLHPSLTMVSELVEAIPLGKITTIDVLAKKMASQYGADVSCPMRTGNHLKALSKSPDVRSIPFWRVVRTNGMMVKLANYAQWASVLEQEGFQLLFTKNDQVKIRIPEEAMFYFD